MSADNRESKTPNLDRLNESLAEAARKRQAIADYMTQHADVFAPYLAAVAEYDELRATIEHQAKQVTAAEVGGKKTVHFGGAVLRGKGSTVVHPQRLVALAGRAVFASYPQLVKDIDVVSLARIYPAVLRDHSELVKEVSVVELRNLVEAGGISQATFDRACEAANVTYSMTAPPAVTAA